MAVPKSIQIRDVPDEVHATMRARAAAAGMSLSDYLRSEIETLARQRTVAEVFERAARRPPTGVTTEQVVRAIRAGRDA
jgi:plasmid stability protein